MVWEWPDSLDALVAAREFHALLFENDDVRVLDTRIGPGETVPVHTHRWPGALYVMSSGSFVRRDGEGNVLVDSQASGIVLDPGTAIWTEALPPHTLENVSDSEIRVVAVELKRR
jgi:quercetin dioxygenase-like cupin family protein